VNVNVNLVIVAVDYWREKNLRRLCIPVFAKRVGTLELVFE
jgi:hypothetical protein